MTEQTNPPDAILMQERLKSLIVNLHEAVLVESEHRKIVLANHSFCQMFGIQAPPEALIGADCSNAAEESKVLFSDPEAFVSRITELLKNRKIAVGDELETKHGIVLERDYIPVFVGGEYFGHLWKYRDITKRKQNEREKTRLINELHEKNAELQTLNEEISATNETLSQTLSQLKNTQNQLIQSEKLASLGQLTAGIAHEINNPVNFISSGVQVLENAMPDLLALLKQYEDFEQKVGLPQGSPHSYLLQKAKKELVYEELKKEIPLTLKDIQVGAERTSEIVKGLQYFSHSNTTQKEDFDVHQAIEASLIIARNQLRRDIEIEHSLLAETQLVKGYPGQLSQVFINLISNALGAIQNEGKVTISTRNKSNTIEISISDTGVGIPEEIQNRIFDPFFTTKPIGKGTGLGLSISYGIIEQHAGSMSVKSKIGNGATFMISLPNL
ncbi:MAG: signal transduction histidine kinase [Bacteroidia bacterium]|jgi:signal transduction histidine kinase